MAKDKFTEDLAAWLKQSGFDRHWLATQIGSTYGTVTQFFSKGFPDWAKLSIDRLMNPLGNKASGLELTFTHDEFMEITEAMRIAGYTRHSDFYHDAITERATDLIETAKKPNVIPLPETPKMTTARVAEGTSGAPLPPQAPITYKPLTKRNKRGGKEPSD